MAKKKKFLLWIGIPLIVLIVAGSVAAGLWFGNDPSGDTAKELFETLKADATLQRAEAQEDLAFVYEKVGKKHYSTIRGVSAEVTAAYENAVSELSDETPVYEVLRLAKKIVRPLGDAHTTLGFYSEPYSDIIAFSDFIKVGNDGKAYVHDYDETKDYEIKKVNGIAWETFLANAREIESYENDYWLYQLVNNALSSPEKLAVYGAGYDREKLALTVADETGTERDRVSKSTVYTTCVIPDKESDYASYRIDREAGLGTLNILQCVYNDRYNEILKEFFTEVKKNGIETVAVDLRRNGGGNSKCMDELFRYLDVKEYRGVSSNVRWGIFDLSYPSKTIKNKIYSDLAFSGDFYVVTSRATFSSATMIATVAYDNGFGKIVGEPTGNAPSAYGDVLYYQLPNSKLRFQISFKRFTRPNAANTENTIPPDHPTDDADALLRTLALQNR